MRDAIILKENEVVEKVDRSSVLGNPFHLKNEKERDKVCKAYEDYFYTQYANSLLFRNEVKRLLKKAETNYIVLACWCAPKRCHAETIKKFLEAELTDVVSF